MANAKNVKWTPSLVGRTLLGLAINIPTGFVLGAAGEAVAETSDNKVVKVVAVPTALLLSVISAVAVNKMLCPECYEKEVEKSGTN